MIHEIHVQIHLHVCNTLDPSNVRVRAALQRGSAFVRCSELPTCSEPAPHHTHVHVCMYSEPDLRERASEEMEGTHVCYRGFGLKFLLMDMNPGLFLSTWFVEQRHNKLTLRERHATGLRDRMRRG